MRGPELEGEHSDLATRWFEALRRSGQAQWFQPSDWSVAEIAVVAIDAFERKPNAALLRAITRTSSSLLVAEGDRRRAHIELERERVQNAGDVAWIEEARRRLGNP